MGNSRIPGPLGWNDMFLDIDDGTLMRCAMPVPGPVGIAATPTVVGTSTAAKAAPTELTWSQIKADMQAHEALILHLYLDSVNKVTVGVGNMLPNLAAAQALAFVKRKPPGGAATADDIKADWNAVNEHAGKNLAARSYAKYTALNLPAEVCWGLLKKRIDHEYLPGLKRAYKDWDQYPLPAKRALLDMAYNLGLHGLSKFKTMNGHVYKLAWDKAAEACERRGIPKERNNWTRARFHEAMPAKDQP
jgi:GH24 family phage-related lysozyme (muramidase)